MNRLSRAVAHLRREVREMTVYESLSIMVSFGNFLIAFMMCILTCFLVFLNRKK
ncbi:putative holin-like toxin [Tumebacillus flagellatus]|uniref:putative holin-like toxin n=1 Tax=Tumebacillus flagellatus TaxID=1157490 RepID=UPI003B75B957